MGYIDRERKIQEEQELELADIMDSLLDGKIVLTTPTERGNLKGTTASINHFRETNSGLGIIKEVDLTILDGSTFMWDRRHPAAIAYGRIHEGNQLLLTGTVLSQSSLRRYDIDPNEVDSLPALITEIPGHFSELDNSIAFRINRASAYTWSLTLGGTSPETRSEIPLPFHPNKRQISNYITTTIGQHIPHF